MHILKQTSPERQEPNLSVYQTITKEIFSSETPENILESIANDPNKLLDYLLKIDMTNEEISNEVKEIYNFLETANDLQEIINYANSKDEEEDLYFIFSVFFLLGYLEESSEDNIDITGTEIKEIIDNYF